MAVLDETRYGCQSQIASLRRVLVRAPRAEDCVRWREFGWRAAPDPGRIAAEHEAFAAELDAFGAEVVFAEEPLPPALVKQLEQPRRCERGVDEREVAVERAHEREQVEHLARAAVVRQVEG